jgi:hypothetical protein
MELVYHIGWRCLAWDILFSCWRSVIEGGNICISLSACQVIVNCKVGEGRSKLRSGFGIPCPSCPASDPIRKNSNRKRERSNRHPTSRVTSGMFSNQIQRQAFLRCIQKTIGLLWFEKIVSSDPHSPDIPYYPYLASGNVDLHLTLVTSSNGTNNDLAQAKPSYLYNLSTANLYILLKLNNPSI